MFFLDLVLRVALGLVPALIARRKGRSFAGWWAAGSIFLIAALPAALLVPRVKTADGGPDSNEAPSDPDGWISSLLAKSVIALPVGGLGIIALLSRVDEAMAVGYLFLMLAIALYVTKDKAVQATLWLVGLVCILVGSAALYLFSHQGFGGSASHAELKLGHGMPVASLAPQDTCPDGGRRG